MKDLLKRETMLDYDCWDLNVSFIKNDNKMEHKIKRKARRKNRKKLKKILDNLG